MVNCLLFKCTDLSSDFQRPRRKSGVVATLYPSTGEVETEGNLGVHSSVSLDKSVISRFSERPCLKNQSGVQARKTANVNQ